MASLAALAMPCALAATCDVALSHRLEPVTDNVWLWPAEEGEVSRDNRGRVAASVVFVDRDGVTVLDPGPSVRSAQRLAAAVACISPLPITRVLNSHAHAENVLGNHGLPEATVWATPRTRDSMQRRCPECLASMIERAGAAELAGTQIRLPTQTLRNDMVIRLAGQDWRVIEVSDAHTESDLVLWNAQSKILVAPMLLYLGRVPELAQGNALAWVRALDTLRSLQPRVVVGTRLFRNDGSEAFANTRRYLCALIQHAWMHLETGALDAQIPALPLPEYAKDAGYTQRHPLNVRRAWREIESDWLRGQAPTACGQK